MFSISQVWKLGLLNKPEQNFRKLYGMLDDSAFLPSQLVFEVLNYIRARDIYFTEDVSKNFPFAF